MLLLYSAPFFHDKVCVRGQRKGLASKQGAGRRALSQPNAAVRDKGMRTSSTSGVQSCLFFLPQGGLGRGGIRWQRWQRCATRSSRASPSTPSPAARAVQLPAATRHGNKEHAQHATDTICLQHHGVVRSGLAVLCGLREPRFGFGLIWLRLGVVCGDVSGCVWGCWG